MQKQIHLSWINAKIGIWLWRKMLPFAAVSSNQISFCVHGLYQCSPTLLSSVMKVNNSSSFLGYSQEQVGISTSLDPIGGITKLILQISMCWGAAGAVHLGRGLSMEAKLQGTMGQRQTRQDNYIRNTVQKNSRHLCQLLNCL